MNSIFKKEKMNIKVSVYILSFLWIWNFQNFADAKSNLKESLVSEEFLYCDNTHIESQLEILKTGNDFLKLRVEIIQNNLANQQELLRVLIKKIDQIPQIVQGADNKNVGQNREILNDINNMLRTQTKTMQTHYQEPPINDKWQLLSDIKKIIDNNDSLFATFSKRLHNVENVLQNASWESHTQHLSDSISRNLTKLENIDKKLAILETTIATKADQIAFNHIIQKYINKNEANNICVILENKKLVCTMQVYPTSCSDFNANYCANGKCRIYNHLLGSETFLVACEDQIDGGGWTVIQRRINGSVDFFRNWSEYKSGFGNIDGEFFIGLDKLHALTSTLQPIELLIHMKDFNDTLRYAKYDEFSIGNETENYKLNKLGAHTGSSSNSLIDHLYSAFTTKDRDNDENNSLNCANYYKGAWWFKSCFHSNLNGVYYDKSVTPQNDKGICWNVANGCEYSLKYVQMMIRPKK